MARECRSANYGARSAACNVRINLPLLEDEMVRTAFERTMAQTLTDAQRIAQQVQDATSAAVAR